MTLNRNPPAGGAFTRRFTDFAGLYFDEFASDSAWIREVGRVRLPPLEGISELVVRGDYRPHPDAQGVEEGSPGIEIAIEGKPAATLAAPSPGPWQVRLAIPTLKEGSQILSLTLTGTGQTNVLAWLGRVTGLRSLQRFRLQNKNRQMRIGSISTADGEIIYDFSQRQAPFSRAFARRHAQLGINIVGFLTADLGIGESARCMVRAADAAGIPSALVPLKLNCRNRLGDRTYEGRLQDGNPYGVNVIHVDPPASRDIDHHHGAAFRAGKYNIAYFAWELQELPDGWVPSLDYYDEVWCPSDFAREAFALKSPIPVLAVPHSISFARPTESKAELRSRFGLPAESFLFLTLFDLNSYALRKNPQAAVEAFRLSGLSSPEATLVVKVQNSAGNPAEFNALKESLRSIPGSILIDQTLSRADVYALEAACDCLVSLHRSEGFGLAVAECMFLGKPAISTDWSATAEFVSEENGCPVRYQLVALEKNCGPYSKGAVWAEPDPAHAAEWMRRLVSEPGLATRLGAAAQVTVETRFSPAVIGARYQQRLESIATF